jgi:primary-amine oxidase
MSLRRALIVVFAGILTVLVLEGDGLLGTQVADKAPQVKPPDVKPPVVKQPGQPDPTKPATGRPKPTADKPFPFPEDEIIQEFPVGGPPQTAWKIRYIGVNPGPGLVITGAWFKTAPEAPWLKVLENVRLSEIFVPYNNSTRIYDIGAQASYSLLKHTQEDAGAHGKLRNNNLVVHEIRDTGILWKYYDKVRRGQDLVLWSTLGAANYNYLIEYAFRCDGSLTARLGSTGKNFGNHETTGHMHHGCWRIDVDLHEGNSNKVFLVKRKEPKGATKATDEIEPFNKNVEGGAHWKAEEFTRVRVESTKLNGQAKFMSYELIPLRPGTPRHWGGNEGFTQFDFWVTPYQWDEQHYISLPKFTAQKRSIANTNVVLWYMSPAYHLPRDEDGVFINPQGRAQVRGVAMTTWCGFELRPRNVFEKSPMYP